MKGIMATASSGLPAHDHGTGVSTEISRCGPERPTATPAISSFPGASTTMAPAAPLAMTSLIACNVRGTAITSSGAAITSRTLSRTRPRYPPWPFECPAGGTFPRPGATFDPTQKRVAGHRVNRMSEERLPLSLEQRTAVASRKISTWNFHLSYHFPGSVNREALASALAVVTARHDP